MKVKLEVREVTARRRAVLVPADNILTKLSNESTPEEIDNFLNAIKANIGKSIHVWSVIDQVLDILNTPLLEKDDVGRVMTYPNGEPRTKSVEMKDQRSINRIYDAVDVELFVFDEKNIPFETIEVDLIERDIIYLAKRVILHAEDFSVAGKHVEEMYDYFMELKKEAELILEKKKSDNQ